MQRNDWIERLQGLKRTEAQGSEFAHLQQAVVTQCQEHQPGYGGKRHCTADLIVLQTQAPASCQLVKDVCWQDLQLQLFQGNVRLLRASCGSAHVQQGMMMCC
jgi:hypothetical protein